MHYGSKESVIISRMEAVLSCINPSCPMLQKRLLQVWYVLLQIRSTKQYAVLAEYVISNTPIDVSCIENENLACDQPVSQEERGDAIRKEMRDIVLLFDDDMSHADALGEYLKERIGLFDSDSLKMHLQTDLGLKAYEAFDSKVFPDIGDRVIIGIVTALKSDCIEDFRLESRNPVPSKMIEASIRKYYAERGFSLVQNQGRGYLFFRKEGKKYGVSYTNVRGFIAISYKSYP